MKLTVRVEPFEESMNRSLEAARKLACGEKVKPSRAFNIDPLITREELFRALDADNRGENCLGLSSDDIDRIIKKSRAQRKIDAAAKAERAKDSTKKASAAANRKD